MKKEKRMKRMFKEVPDKQQRTSY